MERFLYKELLDWKQRTQRKVLLLRGARQVGKTYLVRLLGKTFENYLEVNFEENPKLKSIFTGPFTPSFINEKLTAYFNVPITSKKTLLFFDEIQACPDALRSLRFYHEKMPDLHVIAAGSLLEFALGEIPSFGVGRIESLFLYPLSFNEFLLAVGEEGLRALISAQKSQLPLDMIFHEKLLDLVKTYQLIGGLPEAVKAYCEERNLNRVQDTLDGIVNSYQDDFAKYKTRSPIAQLTETFRAIPLQAGNKFVYSQISAESAPQTYKSALDLLVMAGLAYKVHHTAANGIPLGAQINAKKFKVILFDSGIYQRLLGLNLAEHLVTRFSDIVNKGSLAEVMVGLELAHNTNPRQRAELFYWHREARSSNAEVDYVVQNGGEIIPIEVKSGSKGRMRSLQLFLSEKKLPLGIRTSQENFGAVENIRIVPIYAISRVLNTF